MRKHIRMGISIPGKMLKSRLSASLQNGDVPPDMTDEEAAVDIAVSGEHSAELLTHVTEHCAERDVEDLADIRVVGNQLDSVSRVE